MDDVAAQPLSPEVVWLRDVTTAITSMAAACSDDERIDRIRQFGTLKSVLAAAQLCEAVALDASQRVDQAVAGVASARQGRGIATQLGLATHQSPWHARRWLGWGKVLTSELPVTFAQLRAGATTERRALLMAAETVWLSREDRAEVDAALGPRLPELGDRRVENEARAHAQRLDPAGAAERRRVAERERRVTLRPRPDTMSSLTATNTVERGVEMWARLRRDADSLVGTGQADGRTRDQVMADLHYERVAGRSAATGPGVDVEVIITTDTLLGADTTDDAGDADVPTDVDTDSAERVTRLADYLARLDDDPNLNQPHTDDGTTSDDGTATDDFAASDGTASADVTVTVADFGGAASCDAASCGAGDAATEAAEAVGEPPERVSRRRRSDRHEPALIAADGVTPIAIPASIARQLIADAPTASIRRLFTSPDRSQLLAMESRSRTFPEGLRTYIRLRDQYCSTPYCGAPIRQIDHGHPAEYGGPTNERNGNGKCASCNLAKQAPGWHQAMTGHGRGTLTTPTGHRYRLAPPRLPGALSATDRTPLVDYFWRAIHAA